MVVNNERKRYILIEILGEKPDIRKIINECKNKISLIDGQIGVAKAAIYGIDCKNNLIIIKTNHQMRQTVEAAIALLNDNSYVVETRLVSGTIKKIKTHINAIKQ